MIVKKIPIDPGRVRGIPPDGFSWIDRRFVRDGCIHRLPPEAILLYFFLAAVSDAQGLSFYADPTIGKILKLLQPPHQPVEGSEARARALDPGVRIQPPVKADLAGAQFMEVALHHAQAHRRTAIGLFHGNRMWAAVVNRSGEIVCAVTSTSDPTQVWPGSEAIAKSKAYTANAFSLDSLALSTAQLYTLTQPGHSLNSLGQSNLAVQRKDNKVPSGLIFFGGGVPLYLNGKIIGGLGISGDTASCDHEIAKRVRNLLGLNPPGGALVDDISYSSVDGASAFTHPLSINTWRNGVFIGNEPPAVGY
jgi:uncharacterized protein GlcG (DUF336 family)